MKFTLYLLFISILCFTIEKKGYVSRYWDCCKPSCSLPENSDGYPARHCDASMNTLSDPDEKDICEGGPSTTCLDQIPIIVNDNLAYAFGAVPEKNPCGKCYELIFTGEGQFESRLNQQKLAGKRLIVIATNIGSGLPKQIDILIPGGGVGMYNGCSKILGKKLGRRNGGFLSECEEEVGRDLDDETIYIKRKSCLTNKCNEFFSGNSQALQGCLFLANWMEAAGNPLVVYEEIDCPKELLSKY